MNLQELFDSLACDLQSAWQSRNDVVNDELEIVEEMDEFKKVLNAQNFVYSIDPESMIFLNFLFRNAKESHSKLSLACDIVKGKKLNQIL